MSAHWLLAPRMMAPLRSRSAGQPAQSLVTLHIDIDIDIDRARFRV
jgi:hypothetical protein